MKRIFLPRLLSVVLFIVERVFGVNFVRSGLGVLRRSMSRSEAVLGHEITRVANGDRVTLALSD